MQPTRYPRFIAIAMTLGLTAAIFIFVWFQPHKLFMDDTVGESRPEGARTLLDGDFAGIGHEGKGKALVLEIPDGSRIVRFEEFSTSNGPDLRVYLTKASADARDAEFDTNFLDLGKLKGNMGDQNYRLPSGMDFSDYKSVVIWCRRFKTAFASAPLG